MQRALPSAELVGVARLEPEIGATVLQEDSRSRRYHSRAEVLVQALDQRNRPAILVDGDDRDRTAAIGERMTLARAHGIDACAHRGERLGPEEIVDRTHRRRLAEAL